MKNLKIYLIVASILILLSYGAGFFTMYKLQKPQKPIIKEGPTKYITKIVKSDNEKLWQCYQSPIRFEFKHDQGKIKVKAFDDCKFSFSDYIYEPKRFKHIIMPTLVGGYDFMHNIPRYGGGIDYIYFPIERAGLGGGIIGFNNGVEVKINGALKF